VSCRCDPLGGRIKRNDNVKWHTVKPAELLFASNNLYPRF
jgi:hypothetical protein